MGDTFKKLISIGVAIFAPYAAGALGLTGFAATAFSFVAQAAVGALLGPDDPRAGGGGGVSDSGILLNKQGTNKSVAVVYGDRRIGGTRVYINTSDAGGVTEDDKNEYLHLVIAIANGGEHADGQTGHDLDINKGITKILFNDKTAWDSTDGISDDFDGSLDVRLWYGKTDQTVAAPDVTAKSITGTGLNPDEAVISDEWTSNHRMRGVAYAYLILKYDREKYPGLPTVLFDVQGKGIRGKGNPGTYTFDDATRTNPALVLKDYLLSDRYGKGLDITDLDITSFDSAADYCTTASLEFNGVVQTGGTIFANTQQILSAGNLNLVFSGGKYKCIPIKKESFTNAFTFDTSNILGQWQISLGSKKTRFKKVTVNFCNPDEDWQPDSVVIEPSAYLTEDDGQVNAKTMELPYTGSKTDAERLARFYLDSSRYQTVVAFTSTWEALKLDVGNVCYITHSVPGWSNKKFRVNSLVLQDDSTVKVTLVEYMPDSFTLDGQTYSPYLEDTA